MQKLLGTLYRPDSVTPTQCGCSLAASGCAIQVGQAESEAAIVTAPVMRGPL
jgi:hypothetical protein